MRACAHSSQWKMWRSVPQTEAVSTATRTSVAPTEGTGISRISMPGAAVGFTRACIVFGIIGAIVPALSLGVPARKAGGRRQHFIVARLLVRCELGLRAEREL